MRQTDPGRRTWQPGSNTRCTGTGCCWESEYHTSYDTGVWKDFGGTAAGRRDQCDRAGGNGTDRNGDGGNHPGRGGGNETGAGACD